MTNYTRRQMLIRMSAAGAGAMTLPAILAACGGDDSESGSSGNTTDFTMQAAWINDAEFMGYFIAMDKGYYTEQGLKLNYLPGGPDVIPESSLLGGKAPLALTTPDLALKHT